MRADVLSAYPALDPGPGARRPQRHRHRVLPSRPRHRRRSSGSASTRPGPTSRSSVASPGRRGCRTCFGRGSPSTRPFRWCSSPGAADTPDLKAETDDGDRPSSGARATASSSSRRCCRARRCGRCSRHALAFLLPLGLRAAGHREPRGDGLRDRGRRQSRSVGSPRSSWTARPGLLVDYDRGGPPRLEKALADAGEPLAADPALARADGAGRPRPGGERLRLGGGRRGDRGDLRLPTLRPPGGASGPGR